MSNETTTEPETAQGVDPAAQQAPSTPTPDEPVPAPVVEAVPEPVPVPAPTVSANPAQVEFPRDQWGMTTALRRAGLDAASSIRGDEEKHTLFIETLKILAKHSVARFDSDKAAVEARVRDISRAQGQVIGDTD